MKQQQKNYLTEKATSIKVLGTWLSSLSQDGIAKIVVAEQGCTFRSFKLYQSRNPREKQIDQYHFFISLKEKLQTFIQILIFSDL